MNFCAILLACFLPSTYAAEPAGPEIEPIHTERLAHPQDKAKGIPDPEEPGLHAIGHRLEERPGGLSLHHADRIDGPVTPLPSRHVVRAGERDPEPRHALPPGLRPHHFGRE